MVEPGLDAGSAGRRHDPSQQVQVVRPAIRTGVDAVKQGQGERNQHAARRRLRIGRQAMAAMVADQGRPFDDLIAGEVVHGEMAAPASAVLDDLPCHVAPVEQRLAFGGQGLEAMGQFWHPAGLAILQ